MSDLDSDSADFVSPSYFKATGAVRRSSRSCKKIDYVETSAASQDRDGLDSDWEMEEKESGMGESGANSRGSGSETDSEAEKQGSEEKLPEKKKR